MYEKHKHYMRLGCCGHLIECNVKKFQKIDKENIRSTYDSHFVLYVIKCVIF